jgi:hypothetical protein
MRLEDLIDVVIESTGFTDYEGWAHYRGGQARNITARLRAELSLGGDKLMGLNEEKSRPARSLERILHHQRREPGHHGPRRSYRYREGGALDHARLHRFAIYC